VTDRSKSRGQDLLGRSDRSKSRIQSGKNQWGRF